MTIEQGILIFLLLAVIYLQNETDGLKKRIKRLEKLLEDCDE